MKNNTSFEEQCPYKVEPGQLIIDNETEACQNVKTGRGNVFYRFTRRSLKKNKVRTLVTVIGIMLSMALMTAVLEGAYSGIRYLINVETETEGSWEGALMGCDDAHKEQLADLNDVTAISEWRQVGWAKAGSSNEYKPYLLINSIEDDVNLVNLTLISGRMPENENEIVLPEHLNSNGGVAWGVGDTITLDVGERQDQDGYVLGENNPFYPEIEEEITNTVSKTYTVTGIIERINRSLESYDCPGYTAFTKGGGTGSSIVFFTIKHPAGYYRFINENGVEGKYVSHSDLLTFYGVTGFTNINIVVYGFTGVLLFLIAFGSVSLVYNAFSISVSERTKQFGILKSVGATRRQIQRSVLYEALCLSFIAIPLGAAVGCLGIGLTLYFLKDSFSHMIRFQTETEMHLVISPVILIVAAGVCLLTAIISAWIPAHRAMRISPIEAIRQVKDVNIRSKSVRTSRLTSKIFGFEGMMASKNFKRNRKRYRSVIFSLTLSIILFISASALTMYMKQSVSGASATHNVKYDIRVMLYTGDSQNADNMKILNDLRDIEQVENAALISEALSLCAVENSMFTSDFRDSPLSGGDISDNMSNTMISVAFTDDESFDWLCSKYALDRSEFYDADNPKAIVVNHLAWDEVDADSNRFMFYEADVFNKEMEGKSVRVYDDKPMDGYVFSRLVEAQDGELLAVYYESEMSNAAEDGSSSVTVDNELYLPVEECCYINDLTIGKLITEREYFTNSVYAEFIYPASMMEAVVGDDTSLSDRLKGNNIFTLITPDHSTVRESIDTYLEENKIAAHVYDAAEELELMRMIIRIINVFSYGFIIIISLIAAANVFNTISTNISLRRREFAMLKSIGLSRKGFGKMMNYECLIYGLKGIAWGIPAAIVLIYVMWRINNLMSEAAFFVPWSSVAIAVGSVFFVVFISMIYASGRIRKDNMIDALKNENM